MYRKTKYWYRPQRYGILMSKISQKLNAKYPKIKTNNIRV